MKKTITLALALLTFASVAQYNNTYDVNGNDDNLTPSFVITNKNNESITVSYASDGPTNPRLDYFIITKNDEGGGVIYNNRIYPSNAITDGITNVEALIQTEDEGVLIAGYYYSNSKHVEQPILIKVDVDGKFVWSRIYYENKHAIVSSSINKISLCRVFDDSEENYFIVASSDSDVNSGKDVTASVIKVDNTGKPIFIKKYYDAFNTFTALRNYPGDIEYSKKDNMYMITGYRFEANESKKNLMFFFGINSSGAVVTKFITLQSKSVPIDQDMVYDPYKNVFATTFTHAKTSYVSTSGSLIGFVTVDALMNVSNPKFLWHKEGKEHNGRSISVNKEGNYTICSGIYDGSVGNNPAFLQVDNSGTPIYALLRYNTKDQAFFGHHVLTHDASGNEQYVLVNQQKGDLRIIRTDAGGKACGVEKFEPYAEKYEPNIAYYIYKDQDVGSYKEYEPKEEKYDPNVRKCDGDGTSYRTSNPTGIAQVQASETFMLLYPSVVSADNARITVENTSDKALKLEIHNIAGQLIFSNSQVASGKTEVQLNVNGNLAEGIYIAKIYDANGALIQTNKILITK